MVEKEQIKTKILDCTIRDGGHVVGWNFSEECVKEAYQAATISGVDIFEVGYRYSNPKPEWGDFASCRDDFLFSLFAKESDCKLSVMVDIGKSALNDFGPCSKEFTPLTYVRVSAYPDRLVEAFEFCSGLLEKGYRVFLNLMAISDFADSDFNKIEKWSEKKFLDAFYFADSFGSLYPNDIEKFYNKLSQIGVERISFHSHNNLQLAFANTLKAMELGFYSVDASIYGMGRGAGNLPIELILAHLANINRERFNPIYYLNIIERYFVKLKQENPWGYTIPFMLSGSKNIHPTYSSELEKRGVSFQDICQMLDKIKDKNVISYQKNELENFVK